jgi:hypothetical protein
MRLDFHRRGVVTTAGNVFGTALLPFRVRPKVGEKGLRCDVTFASTAGA